ncbi:MAG: T9SS type A sorting domain-containing protein [Candidatus Margulisbacteria bacterium]|nr:T9SS type A sorting domain-containing protein [Candidatus Margulisiibacteriota bacterium]
MGQSFAFSVVPPDDDMAPQGYHQSASTRDKYTEDKDRVKEEDQVIEEEEEEIAEEIVEDATGEAIEVIAETEEELEEDCEEIYEEDYEEDYEEEVVEDAEEELVEETEEEAPTTTLASMGRPMNYPNPFKPAQGQSTTIRYELPQNYDTTVMIFDMTGRQIWRQTYLYGTPGGSNGVNEITWDGHNPFGTFVANGVYYYVIVGDGKVQGRGEMAVYN